MSVSPPPAYGEKAHTAYTTKQAKQLLPAKWKGSGGPTFVIQRALRRPFK